MTDEYIQGVVDTLIAMEFFAHMEAGRWETGKEEFERLCQ